MSKIDKQKMSALLSKHSQKQGPPRKPGGGKPPQFSKHVQQEAQHEGESPEKEQHEHDQGGGDKEVDVEAVIKQVENGQVDSELADLVEQYNPEDGPPTWAKNADMWEKATQLVEPHADKIQDKNLVVAHVYKELGGQIDKGDEDEGDNKPDKHEHEDHEHDEHGDDE